MSTLLPLIGSESRVHATLQKVIRGHNLYTIDKEADDPWANRLCVLVGDTLIRLGNTQGDWGARFEAWLDEIEADGLPLPEALKRNVARRIEARRSGSGFGFVAQDLARWAGLEDEWHAAVAAERERRAAQDRADAEKRAVEEARWAAQRKAEYEKSKAEFALGVLIDPHHFERLCEEYGVALHPRTVGTLRARVTGVAPGKVTCEGRGGLRGVFDATYAVQSAMKAEQESLQADNQAPEASQADLDHLF